MHLSPSLIKSYTSEHLSARDAQRLAEFIAFGPIVFQVARIMRKWGILEMLRDEPLTIDEVAQRTGKTVYAVKCLLEASLTIGLVLVDPESDKFTISKTGWFLICDPATDVNIDFNHDVNYLGMFDLENALESGKPTGLKRFGTWSTVYEGLSQLPADAQRSWFAFDHFYSDSAFDEALKVVFANPTRTLLDVGGNTGRWALRCVGYDSNVEVTILDLPQQVELMKEQTSGKPGAGRISGYGMDLLDADAHFPTDRHYDAIWMSQFLDCFAPEQIVSIVSRAAQIMDQDSTLYVMENLWDRQKYEPEAFCLTQISLYFTCIANGNSKMYHSEDLFALIEKAGLKVVDVKDNLGQGHSLLLCKKNISD
jgi:ubiquinone/menaquinone biosynthesis C-methylase UbiE